MADFRRVVTALAVLVLLTGFAVSANAAPYSCNASAAVPPLLRGEGLTELAGDILLTCAGDINLAANGNPKANFTIFLGGSTTFTSRILTASNNATEAALLINEPTGTFTKDADTFQGILTGSNAITFTGVPLVTAPGSVPVGTFRITNLRVNASNLATPNAVTQVTALISISGSTSVPLNNPQQIIGFVQARSMSFSVLGTDGKAAPTAGFSFKQCDINSNKLIGSLQFAEVFASAFKPKVDASGQTATGSVFNTESGLLVGFTGTSKDVAGATAQAGLADFGTRLRATFKGVPANVKLFVSAGNQSGAGVATPNKTEAGKTDAVTPITDGFPVTDPVVQVSLDASGNGTVVWEVTSASPIVLDKFQFNVYINAAPTPGPAAAITATAGTVAGSYAPTYTDPAAAQASATLPIPRFIDTGVANNLLIFTVCQTNLLFPYVVNVSGFDTGIAITNTGKDPFNTVGQSGTCSLSFFGANPPATNPVVTASLGNGTGETNLYAASAMTLAPGFSGYVIAVCNFQYAHGFAFVSDIGAHDVAMGYLALVLPSSNRAATATPENLNN